MNEARPDIRLWVIGLVIFVIVIVVGMTLDTSTPFGIRDHQIAGTAERVNEIQNAWRNAGYRTLAIAAMAGDLIFIGVYSLGAWRAGKSFAGMQSGMLSFIGKLVMAAAVIFLVTDYFETILQFIQMVQDQGEDWMAAAAASVQEVKVLSWIVSFLGLIVALVTYRIGRRAA